MVLAFPFALLASLLPWPSYQSWHLSCSYSLFDRRLCSSVLLFPFGGIDTSLIQQASHWSKDGHTSVSQSSSATLTGAAKGLGANMLFDAYCIAPKLSQIFHRELIFSTGSYWKLWVINNNNNNVYDLYDLCTATVLWTVLKGRWYRSPQPYYKLA